MTEFKARPATGDSATDPSGVRRKTLALFLGPLFAVALYLLLPESYTDPEGMVVPLSSYGRFAAAVGLCMAVWWMTEAIPVYVTALLPMALFPLAEATSIKVVAAPYGHPLVFLFLGGFIVALSLERWGLHKRIALVSLRAVGSSPAMIVGAFMTISALLSMWVTNTATTIMLLPVALSVISLLPEPDNDELRRQEKNFSLCLLLGIAYAASIGGIGTIIGTAPNLFVVSFLQEQLNITISFVKWMMLGVPLVVVFVPLAWLVLTRWVYPLHVKEIPGAHKLLAEANAALAPVSIAEKRTLLVFLLTAAAWIFRPLLQKISLGDWQPLAGLTDTGVALFAALVLFIVPSGQRSGQRLMNWPTALKLPWGLLLLFGGGLSLAAALDQSGFSRFLGSQAEVLGGLPVWLIIVVVVSIVIFLTELTSNFATTATLVPILYAVSVGLNIEPQLIIIPAAIAASCAFMLPVATPPNAIVFGSGQVTVPQMSRAGFSLNLLGIVLVSTISYAILLLLVI